MKRVTILILALFSLAACKKEATIEKGSIIFYTDEDNGCGEIEVSMGSSKVGTISNYSTTGAAPSCGTVGYLTLDLDPGSYSYNAVDKCNVTWSGTFNITENGCFRLLLDR
jgi:hypothetical protein